MLGVMGIIESYVSPVRMEEAMDIMGRNAFTIDDAINAFKISPSQHHVAALNYVPYTENTLTECKDTHDLIAILPISIMKIRDVANHEWPGQIFSSKFWYRNEPFATKDGETVWQLISKTPIRNSFLKTFDEQENIFLAKSDEVPRIRRLIYTMAGRFLAKGERMFENIYLRCADKDSFGVRLSVSGLSPGGLTITNEFGNRRNRDICLVPVRKYDSR